MYQLIRISKACGKFYICWNDVTVLEQEHQVVQLIYMKHICSIIWYVYVFVALHWIHSNIFDYLYMYGIPESMKHKSREQLDTLQSTLQVRYQCDLWELLVIYILYSWCKSLSWETELKAFQPFLNSMWTMSASAWVS